MNKKHMRLMVFTVLTFITTWVYGSENNSSIEIGKTFNLHSEILADNKEIYVSLPPKYHEHKQQYPVIYVLEAEYLFASTATIIQFIANRSKMPASIVIGVATGGHAKRKEMAFELHGGKPEKYLKFLEKELIPKVEKKFRTNNNRTIIGLSPSNGVVFESLFSGAHLFNNYIALTTHWEWSPRKGISMVEQLIKTITQPDMPAVNLYMGTADDDLRYSHTQYHEAVEKLKNIGKTRVNFQVELLHQEEHYLTAISGLRNAFKLIYPNDEWGMPNLMDHKDPVAVLKAQYDKLTRQHGFDIYPNEDGHVPADHILGWATTMMRFKKFTTEQAIEVLKLAISYYPNSANAHRQLAELYFQINHPEANKVAEKAMLLVSQYHPEFKLDFEKKLVALGMNKDKKNKGDKR